MLSRRATCPRLEHKANPLWLGSAKTKATKLIADHRLPSRIHRMFVDAMQKLARLSLCPGLVGCLLAFLCSPGDLHGQTSSEPGKPGEPLNWTTQQDHKNMMEQ